ncbi:MAG: iron-containing alcohol dehydrogenase [Pseudomonadota bacterium]
MNFTIARLPRIDFGPGALSRLPARIADYGKHALIVTGARSFSSGPHWAPMISALTAQGVAWELVHVEGEPSPALVDQIVVRFRQQQIDCVVGVGGGSALDAAKAIAGLLKPGNSVLDHLEGVGPELPYRGPTTPFIAVPTTAGTGSEATKNAVLSVQGEQGFKKSFRDDQLVAEWAIVDPDLLANCPPAVVAANGMDALTQLLESYVSTRANPMMDALAISGLERVRSALLAWYENQGDLATHRADMAYAALLSGITLANVGLGSVHGLASPLGAFFPIPHGVVCGTLVAEACRINIAALKDRAPASAALAKYAHLGCILAGQSMAEDAAHQTLVEILTDWTHRLQLPRLGAFGVTEADIPRIVAHSRGSSMKTNPIELTDTEIGTLVLARL